MCEGREGREWSEEGNGERGEGVGGFAFGAFPPTHQDAFTRASVAVALEERTWRAWEQGAFEELQVIGLCIWGKPVKARQDRKSVV